MQQLEIQYFFPLTEQIPLGLDFTRCEEYELERRKQLIAGSTLLVGSSGTWATNTVNLTPTFQFKPEPDSVGYWAIGNDNLQVWRKQRPNWLHQKMTKFFFGWEWNDK